ncbi:putative sugar O-methyltransferase [Magnetospirillum sp. UT-4]|uniref:putative sugar O-methyltransferase n=1 Tax=Magnetospirillum sp. UT-4 TaxID=2681467 RepID=UPI00138528D6|nr:putative sugar O-methyltransferase [Magnetospirillum sp. UT-4]CAA7621763.1 conserved hypothetical protein [Magnetospirillum sp. UT-4]
MLTGLDALRALEAEADAGERSQSAYWRDGVKEFSVQADGTVTGSSVLGMVSRKRGAFNRFAHWVLQAPFRRMGRRFAPLAQALAIGHVIAERQRRAYTYDLLRHSLSLALIRHHLPLDRDDRVSCVIGDGYGMMASHLLLDRPGRKVVSVNLTKPLLLDMVFIAQALPGIGIALVRSEAEMEAALADAGVRVIAVQADNAAAIAAAPVDLAVNIVSMQEMDPPVVAEYFRLLRATRSDRTCFYCCNKLWKRLVDGTEVKFSDYPWRPGDRILLDEVCTWSQWVYSKIPPFWHYRRGDWRVIWHRLAWLDKDGGR